MHTKKLNFNFKNVVEMLIKLIIWEEFARFGKKDGGLFATHSYPNHRRKRDTETHSFRPFGIYIITECYWLVGIDVVEENTLKIIVKMYFFLK